MLALNRPLFGLAPVANARQEANDNRQSMARLVDNGNSITFRDGEAH
jgi:hypothetical protein